LWLLDHAVRVTTGAPRPATSLISPGIVLGGQFRRRGWRRLSAAGVTSVLNMRSEFCDREAGIAPAQYLRLPTIDDEAPTPEQLREGVAFIRQQVAQGGGVYVHCKAGMGRAATMVAAYLVTQGLGPDEAWASIRRVRPFIRPTALQRAAIEAWAVARAS
jgi:protein-tyrosine phosphatase